MRWVDILVAILAVLGLAFSGVVAHLISTQEKAAMAQCGVDYAYMPSTKPPPPTPQRWLERHPPQIPEARKMPTNYNVNVPNRNFVKFHAGCGDKEVCYVDALSIVYFASAKDLANPEQATAPSGTLLFFEGAQPCWVNESVEQVADKIQSMAKSP